MRRTFSLGLWVVAAAVLSEELHCSPGHGSAEAFRYIRSLTEEGGKKGPNVGAQRHEVGIIARFIDHVRARNRRHAKHWGNSRTIASHVLELPSWACYAISVVLAVSADDSTAYRLKRTEHEKLAAMCETYPVQPDSELMRNISGRVILNRQHNGFGNQIFQYSFTRLLAESLEIPWSSTLIRPELGESPRRETMIPPNSYQGWELFRRIFDNSTLFAHDGANRLGSSESPAERVERVCRDPNNQVVLSDRPADTRDHGALANQVLFVCGTRRVLTPTHISHTLSRLPHPPHPKLINAFFGSQRDKPCLKFIGYFQEGLFFLPVRDKLLQWLAVPPPLQLPQVLREPTTVVLHVRSCGCCKWHWLSFDFYDTILSHLRSRDTALFNLFVVAPGTCHSSELVKSMKVKYAAQVIESRQGIDGMIQDFLYMMHAPRLILGKSTFGFWAGYLSTSASEIHLPIEMKNNKNEKIPVMYNDDRFTYHGARGDWFGKFQSNSIRYEFHTTVEPELGKNKEKNNSTKTPPASTVKKGEGARFRL